MSVISKTLTITLKDTTVIENAVMTVFNDADDESYDNILHTDKGDFPCGDIESTVLISSES